MMKLVVTFLFYSNLLFVKSEGSDGSDSGDICFTTVNESGTGLFKVIYVY